MEKEESAVRVGGLVNFADPTHVIVGIVVSVNSRLNLQTGSRVEELDILPLAKLSNGSACWCPVHPDHSQVSAVKYEMDEVRVIRVDPSATHKRR